MEDKNKPSETGIDYNAIETILERLRTRELPNPCSDIASSLQSVREAPEPTSRRSRRRKRDVRTFRRIKRELYRNLPKDEKADRARSENGSLKGQYHKLRREIKRRREGRVKGKEEGCWEWSLTLAEWIEIWSNCPLVQVGFNYSVPAWKARGRDSSKDVQIKRIDATKPFQKDNMTVFRGRIKLY